MFRINYFSASIRAPNPDFANRPKMVGKLLEETKATSAKVELKSEELETKADAIRDLVEYGEEGYSTIKAKGECKGQQRSFDSKRKIANERVYVPATTELGQPILDKQNLLKRMIDKIIDSLNEKFSQ